jgi:hypothetical protein
MVLVFVLLVFTIGQFVLSDALSGRDQALTQLRAELAQLAECCRWSAAPRTEADLAQVGELSGLARQSPRPSATRCSIAPGRDQTQLSQHQAALEGSGIRGCAARPPTSTRWPSSSASWKPRSPARLAELERPATSSSCRPSCRRRRARRSSCSTASGRTAPQLDEIAAALDLARASPRQGPADRGPRQASSTSRWPTGQRAQSLPLGLLRQAARDPRQPRGHPSSATASWCRPNCCSRAAPTRSARAAGAARQPGAHAARGHRRDPAPTSTGCCASTATPTAADQHRALPEQLGAVERARDRDRQATWSTPAFRRIRPTGWPPTASASTSRSTAAARGRAGAQPPDRDPADQPLTRIVELRPQPASGFSSTGR